MSEPFIGEIRMFGGTFAPRNWALCDGQLLSISSNDALFSLLGTIYGGDGRTTFGLPDLRGRVPVGAGAGPGLPTRNLGTRSGSESVQLTAATNASHSHTGTAKAHSTGADRTDPTNASLSVTPAYSTAGANTAMAAGSATVANVGGGQPHNNVQPFQTVNYIIALLGVYPSQA